MGAASRHCLRRSLRDSEAWARKEVTSCSISQQQSSPAMRRMTRRRKKKRSFAPPPIASRISAALPVRAVSQAAWKLFRCGPFRAAPKKPPTGKRSALKGGGSSGPAKSTRCSMSRITRGQGKRRSSSSVPECAPRKDVIATSLLVNGHEPRRLEHFHFEIALTPHTVRRAAK